MDDLQDVADRTSSVLHQLHVQANQSPELASREARALALRIRAGRRRAIAGTGSAAAVVGVVIAAGVSFIGHSADAPHTNTPEVLPRDQPACPAVVPSQPGSGGVLDVTHPSPALATLCIYDPRTQRLDYRSGTFHPLDIPGFLGYVRSLPVVDAGRCSATATAVAAASVQILFADHTEASLVFRSTDECVAISDGAATKTVRVAALAGQWRNVIDPVLSLGNPPPPSVGPSGSLPPVSSDATTGPPTASPTS